MGTTAMERLTKRLEANPDSCAFARLADYHREAGDIDKAVAVCAAGLERHPESATGHLVLGRCCVARENFSAAAAELTKVCRLDPRSIAGLKLLGDIFLRQGQEGRAGDLYALVESMDPFCDLIADAARAHRGSGKTDLVEILADNPPADFATLTSELATGEIESVAVGEPLDMVGPGTSLDAAVGAGEEQGAVALAGVIEEAVESEPVRDQAEMPEDRGTAEAAEPEAIDLSDRMDVILDDSGIMPDEEHSGVNGDILIIPKSSSEVADDTEVQPLSEIPNGAAISAHIENLFEKETIKMPALTDVAQPEMKETAAMPVIQPEPAEPGQRPPQDPDQVKAACETAAPIMAPDAEPEMKEIIADGSVVESIDTLPQDDTSEIVVSDNEDSRAQLLSEEKGHPGGAAFGAESPDDITVAMADALIADADQEAEVVVFEEVSRDLQKSETRPPEKAAAVRPDDSASGKAEELPDYIITPTFAEIFFQQGQLHRALNIFQRLAKRDPGNALFRERIDETEKAIASGSEGYPVHGQERGSASKKVID